MNLERIQIIYGELEKYVVQLHPDPRSLGPVYLNDLIATTRNYLNAVSRIQLEVHREKQTLDRDIRAREAAYQISFDEFLANDERVRRLPSIEDRKATVGVFLRADKQIIDNLKAAIQDLEYVEKAVKHRHKELTSTMSEIKLQRSLIRDEIDTGAMYGDERTGGSSTRTYTGPAGEVEFSEDELDRILAEVQKARTPELPPAPPPQPPIEAEVIPVEPKGDEAAIAAFLGDSTTDEVLPAIDEEDLEKVFQDL